MPGHNLTAVQAALKCGTISDPAVLENLRAQTAESTPVASSAPATSSSAGTPGQLAYDATHLYVCVAPNTWVRVLLATF